MSDVSSGIVVKGLDKLEEMHAKYPISVAVLHEEWGESCSTVIQAVNTILKDETVPKNVGFALVQAEDCPDVCEKYNVTGVPTTIVFQGKKEVFRVVGTRVREVEEKLKQLSFTLQTDPVMVDTPRPASDVDLNEKIKKLINQADVMLFMKGTPAEPQCGFSRTIVSLLDDTEVPYQTFNILADNDIREGLKAYSNWRTYPQLYVKGQLLGGLDIVKEMQESGELMAALKG